ncbi:60S ribosomal protein L31-like [Rattus rattus]|uniref:60S ribosomal protein L31-like n=1 Tax=Rattus rattus TaxID=10117 RepID=UPI0013F2D269|nr:60S ribosomal protein L31-like [Rattus rattus]
MAPAEKGGEKKKGCSAVHEVVTREYTINLHKRIHEVGSKKRALSLIKLLGQGNKECSASPLSTSGKHSGDEDSPNKLYALVTYVPVTTFKNLQMVNADES